MRRPLQKRICIETNARNHSLVYWLWLAIQLVLSVTGLLAVETSSSRQPLNILFLLADDMRPDTIHALGNRVIQTPNLDRLVRYGTAFTRVIAANPICTPSRAEILTGCNGFKNGVTYFGHAIKPGVATWPQTMRAAGYHTWYVGKWHNDGLPTNYGYEEGQRLFLGGMGPQTVTFTNADGSQITGHSSRLFADAAIDFLNRKPRKPFFLHVNFKVPHDPREIPPGYEHKYDSAKIPLPKNFLPAHPFDNGEMKVRDELLLPWPRTPDAIRKELAAYYAMISHLDEQLGRILAVLKANGQDKNTIVIFASDQGLALGSHGLLGKQNMYDHSLGAPLIFCGPGIPKNRRAAAPCYLRDLFPTVCELNGLEVPSGVQGRSLAPVVKGKAKSVYPYLFAHYRNVQRMVQTEKWKLIWYPKIDRYQLFNVAKDPNEVRDLSEESRYAVTLAAMKSKLLAAQREQGDTLDPNLQLSKIRL